MKAKLIIKIKDVQEEFRHKLNSKEQFSIGRSPRCKIPVADPKLSRIHCIIFFEKNNFYIKDNGSTNGTFLNGEQITKVKKLRNEATIKFGNCKCKFYITATDIEEIDAKDLMAGEPEIIDDYRIIEKIGGGGIGVVYKAKHKINEQIFAIKVLKPEAAEDNTMVTRFLKEARACASLDHPSLIKIYDIGIYDQAPYLALEYVPGGTLAEFIVDKKQVDCYTTLHVAEKIVEGLVYCHSLEIIHRDIKPANILVDPETLKTKIIDMGMVKMLNESGITLSGQTLGTPRYMPLEQINDSSKVDHRADIYAVGATMYHMLVGQPPYYEVQARRIGELLKAIIDNPPQAISKIIDIPPIVSKLINTAMDRKLKKRFSTAEAFLKQIQKVKSKVGRLS